MTLISSPIGSAFTIVTFRGTALELKKEHDYKYNTLSIRMIDNTAIKMGLISFCPRHSSFHLFLWILANGVTKESCFLDYLADKRYINILSET